MTAPPAVMPASLADIRGAAAALAGIAYRTPLVASPALAAARGAPVRFKPELCQPIGAFKIRGAWTAVTRLDAAARARGILTHSSGNHGQAIAWVGQRLGIRAVVVMPDDSPKVKVAGVRARGGEVVFCARGERVQVTEAIAAREGLTFIHPFEHEHVVLGQATLGLELLEDAPDTGVVLVPTGGGGLLAGVASAARALGRDVRLVAVEPAGAPKVTAALAAGVPVGVERPASIADGLLSPAVGRIPHALFHDLVREAITVTDAEIEDAVRWLHEAHQLRVEPSGAVAVAALRAGKVTGREPAAAILTGGNIDDDLFARLAGA